MVQHGLLSLPWYNRVFFPCWCLTGSSFPAVVQQVVCKSIFFPFWCFTGYSFSADDSHGLLSLLVLHKFPNLKFYLATKQNKRFQDSDIYKTRWHSLSYFRSRGHPAATVCFNSNRQMVWVEKSKIDLQDGGYGGHFWFPIGMILTILHLHISMFST